jgi:hypothetical protein
MTPVKKADKPCFKSTFQLDMNASEFGVCAKCVWKKADHTQEPVGSPAAARSRAVSLKIDGPSEPCETYKLDLVADSFGACACGFSKKDHKNQTSNLDKVAKTLSKRWDKVQRL